MKLFGYILIIFALPLSAAAEEVDYVVQVSVSPSQCTIGDPVEIIQIVTTQELSRFRWQELPESVADFQIIASHLEQNVAETGAVINQRVIRLVPFATGDLSFPQASFELISDDGISTTGNFPAAKLTVISVSQNDSALATQELKDIMEPPEKKSYLWLYITLGSIAILALAIFLIWRHKHMPKRVKDLIKLTPAERALQDLFELEKEELFNKQDYETHFTRASFTVKQYLAMRYHIAALEKTSAELNSDFSQVWTDHYDLSELLGEVLKVSDLVKFAKYSPAEVEGSNSIEYSRNIINETRDDLVKRSEEEA